MKKFRLRIGTGLAAVTLVGVTAAVFRFGSEADVLANAKSERASVAEGELRPWKAAPPRTPDAFTKPAGEEVPAPAGQAANCPVAKPKKIPDALKAVFSIDPSVHFEARKKALEELGGGAKDEECARALRWLAHQNDVEEALRNEVLMTLGAWHTDWLPDDLIGMLNDRKQPDSWRANCVKHLSMHHATFRDKTSMEGLEAAARSADAVVNDVAIFEFARLAQELVWIRNEPKRMAEVNALAAKALQAEAAHTVLAGLRAVEVAPLTEQTEAVERLAANEQRAPEIRVEAVHSLQAVARWESLAVLEACAKSPLAPLAKAAQSALPFAWVAQLGHADAKLREKAFLALGSIHEQARPALEKAMLGEESVAQELARTLFGNILLEQNPLKLVERKGLAVFCEDPVTKNPGVKSILLDPEKKLIVVDGEYSLESGALEYAVVCKGENAKLHESLVALDCGPLDLCYALLKCNYTNAGELRANGTVNLPPGAGVMLSVEYEREYLTPAGKEKRKIRAPIDVLIWNSRTGRPMKRSPWAFTGSRFQRMPNGRDVLMAVLEKSVAAIVSDPNALLNTPLDSADVANTDPREVAYYEINRAVAPKRGTKCNLVFEPWTGEKLRPEDVHDRGEPKEGDGEQKAEQKAEPVKEEPAELPKPRREGEAPEE